MHHQLLMALRFMILGRPCLSPRNMKFLWHSILKQFALTLLKGEKLLRSKIVNENEITS